MSTPTNIIIPITNLVTITNKMNEYQELDILTDWVVGIGTLVLATFTIILAVFTIGLFFIARKVARVQIPKLLESTNISKTKMIMEIEREINSKFSEMEKAKIDFEFKTDSNRKRNDFHKEVVIAARRNYDRAIEGYLFTLNNLCEIILSDDYIEKKYRRKYKNIIFKEIQLSPEFLGPNTKWTNITALNDKWQSEDD